MLIGAVLVVTMGACGASSRKVRGPDGEKARLISCMESADCYTKASEVCPDGYVIREGHGLSPASTGQRMEMLVSCKTDIAASVESTSASTASNRDDTLVCEAASKFIGEFGAYWVTKSGGLPLDEQPAPRDFIVTCQAMAENVQRCMHEKYRHAHEQACEALLGRLDPFSRNRIDALFLQIPAEKKTRAAAPGTNL